ncbi:TetR/AcrR family transcriptional regulator [uncultured Microbacterium sp.]|uniref:TetR/AcrR family transcriptional regulator n=3 Tax=uncultured Microbacterium sp. TaxID=191216 RepID=UPI0037493D3D
MATEHVRDPEGTRAAILQHAESLVATRGLKVSLADVAKAAGVSKSGLLHHFASRNALLCAVADHGMRAFIDDVVRDVDPGDREPGARLRAYVRTLCGGSARAMALFSPTTLSNGIIAVPGMKPLLEADADWWRDFFAADGLSVEHVLVVRHAAEGIAAASAVEPYLRDTERRVARDALLALTHRAISW